jgi:diketogulonate reductase-like aldo/keto reductase
VSASHGLANPQNEEAIAEALQESGVPRSEVYITSKVSPYQQGTDKATAACNDILARLNTDYVVRWGLWPTL